MRIRVRGGHVEDGVVIYWIGLLRIKIGLVLTPGERTKAYNDMTFLSDPTVACLPINQLQKLRVMLDLISRK